MLLLLVFGPVGVLIGVLLRPIAILLLDREPLHVVRVHDLLDALVVVKDGKSGHLVEVSQVLVIPVPTLDEDVACCLQGCAAHGPVGCSASHPFLLSFFGPVRAHSIVEGCRAPELITYDFRLAFDFILGLRIPRGVKVIFKESEVIVLDRHLGLARVHGLEALLIDFAERLTVLVSHDVSVSDLLVNRWVVQQGARLFILFGHHGLLIS